MVVNPQCNGFYYNGDSGTWNLHTVAAGESEDEVCHVQGSHLHVYVFINTHILYLMMHSFLVARIRL